MDTTIHVYKTSEEDDEQYSYMVGVQSPDGSQTQHAVTLLPEYYKALTAEEVTPEELIERSFGFLLERESKEEILPSFDLALIQEYFPEYERTIRNELSGKADA